MLTPTCSNTRFLPPIIKGSAIKEEDLLIGLNNQQKQAVLTRYKYYIRDKKARRVVVKGVPYYVPVEEVSS